MAAWHYFCALFAVKPSHIIYIILYCSLYSRFRESYIYTYMYYLIITIYYFLLTKKNIIPFIIYNVYVNTVVFIKNKIVVLLSLVSFFCLCFVDVGWLLFFCFCVLFFYIFII